jgi:hypothetical protein
MLFLLNPGLSYNFLLVDGRIWIRIQETQKHTDPTDPDPEHSFQVWFKT